MKSDALSLEYKRLYGCARRNVDVADLVNNPAANGVVSVLSLSFDEERSALLVDLTWIIQHADGIALLPGWSASYGARAEAFIGHALGLRVASVSEWLGR